MKEKRKEKKQIHWVDFNKIIPKPFPLLLSVFKIYIYIYIYIKMMSVNSN